MNTEPPSISGGLFVAGIPASFLSVFLMFGSAALFAETPLFGSSGVVSSVGALALYSIVGLPVAWLTMFAVGIPLWRSVAKEGPLTFASAARLGAIAAMIIGAIETFAVLLTGASSVAYRGLAFVVTKHAFDVACTIGIGAFCGVVANYFVWSPKDRLPDEA